MSRIDIGLWQLEVRAKKRVDALLKNGFDAHYHETDHPERICRVYSIIERRPPSTDITVLVCGEPLGL